MSRDRAFVYAVCGKATHIKTIHRSLEYLSPRTELPIIVVTDSRRNEIPVEHANVIDVATPGNFDHHQASIFLKTSLHRILPAGPDYVYLDSDVLAVDANTDRIFEHRYGPVTFAKDVTFAEHRVGMFSPWAVNCSCPRDRGIACVHLTQAIERKFGVRVPAEWVNWNGGVFLFGPDAATFLDTWHSFTMQIFEDPYWKTRDQGTLIATVWKLGLNRQNCLPPQFNFILDQNNQYLRFDRGAGYTWHESLPFVRPSFLHLYHADLDRPGWTLERDVEDVLEKRTEKKVEDQRRRDRAQSLAINTARLAKTPAPCDRAVSPDAIRVIVGRPDWSLSSGTIFSETLVRSLRKAGADPHVLLTESTTDAHAPGDPLWPLPADLRIESLPVAADASWGTRWGTLVRYLEDRAPCIYLPVGDWRNSNVSVHLSSRVAVIGVVRGDDPRHYDEVQRLGRYWNAIVAPTQAVAARLIQLRPELAGRVVEIRPGVDVDGLSLTREPRSGDDALRIFYHGCLSDRRKRVFDLPRIAEALLQRGVPVQLSIAGDGPDWGALMTACDSLMKSGAVRWLGILPHPQVLDELQSQDVWLTTAGLGSVPLAVLEAAARGCVPVVGDAAGVSEFVLDGINGYRVAPGDLEGFLCRLETLYRDSQLRRQLSAAAQRSVPQLRVRSEVMAEDYVALFHRAIAETARGGFRRPDGLLHLPPYQVEGTEVFPVRYFRGIENVGVFPSYREDCEDYRNAIGESGSRKFPAWRKSLVRTYPAILASSATNTRFVAALADGLRQLDRPVQVLIPPGASSEWIERAGGLTIVPMPVSKAPWRPSHQALAEYLERQAPCFYLPGDDPQYWTVCPRLSNRIAVIGRVSALSPELLRHAAEMARYWDAIVAESHGVAEELTKLNPGLCPRMVTIPDPIGLAERLPARPRDWDAPLKVAHCRKGDPPWPADTIERAVACLAQEDVQVELVTAETAADSENAGAVVVLSDSESAATHLMQAMARGWVPLVGRGRGVLSEYIRDGQNGYVLPDGDLQLLVARLRALYMSPLLERLLSVGAFKTAASLNSTSGLVDAYSILFQRVMEDLECGGARGEPRTPSSSL
jgi:glycosyltransferase involved in cell wall biosynthesis